MHSQLRATRHTYVGLFIITLATLMYEILLTRIFSVTMWYHFAFMAISVAMFGMTTGAILVYLLARYFTPERTKYHMALGSLLFSVSIVLSFLTHLCIPFVVEASIAGVYSMALTYVVISIPFIFSGICVCLALTRFDRQVSTLYAADLIGAAAGCVLFVYLLKITDGPTAVIAVALLAGLGAVVFAGDAGSKRTRRVSIVLSLLLAAFTAGHTVLVHNQSPWLRLLWVKGRLDARPLYEKWNSFSRVTVDGDADRLKRPFGWGLSFRYPRERKVRELWMTIDAFAGTPLTGFDGDVSGLEHLKYDVTNVAHYIRPDATVLAVGVGGGRDILSALAFEQKSVIGVEINEDILHAINRTFGEFTGHLDKNPKVTFVHDEARSYIARSKNHVDIIQISLIDTFAASAAGALVLSENSLYTIEAWRIILDHLTPDGVFTCSRWFSPKLPGEMYKITCLASATLKGLGVENPRDHIVILRQPFHMGISGEQPHPYGVGNLLVCKSPFSEKDLNVLEAIAARMKFDVMLSPRASLDATFKTLASGENLDEFTERFPINIAAPTDNSPFFFNMTRPRDMLKPDLWRQGRITPDTPIFVLGTLLAIVVVLTLLCIVVPLILTTKPETLRGASPLVLFFACIGLGFMFVEISQMQRLIIFLGHPTYGLCVVLFVLLVASGLGSYTTRAIDKSAFNRSAIRRLSILLGLLILFGMLTPYAVKGFEASITPVRVLVAGCILFPLGIFMGMAFPLGIITASTRSTALTPWLWGINGATSVCASVLATAISLTAGISAAFWAGFLCYVVALIAFCRANRGRS